MFLGLASSSRTEVREGNELPAVDFFLHYFFVLKLVVETMLVRSSSDDQKNALE